MILELTCRDGSTAFVDPDRVVLIERAASSLLVTLDVPRGSGFVVLDLAEGDARPLLEILDPLDFNRGPLT